MAKLIVMFNKEDKINKQTFRHTSPSPYISKVFELIYTIQMMTFCN